MTLPWTLPTTLGCPGVIAPTGATLTLTGGTPDVIAECDSGTLPWTLPIALGLLGVVNPTGMTLTLTGGTPTVIVGAPGILPWTLPTTLGLGPGIISPPGASLTLSGGTPTVSAGTIITPTGVSLTLTGGTPTVFINGAFATLINRLSNNLNASIVALGDSTVRGTLDTSSPFLYGWPGRLAILLGTAFNVNVYVNADTNSTAKINNGWGSSTATLHTSTLGASAATLTLYNGAVGGSELSDQESYITHNNLLEYAADADVIFTGTGFNDIIAGLTNTEYVAAYQTFIANIQTAAPGVPIIITTENQTNFVYGDISQALFYSAFTALAEAYVGQPLPLTPPLMASSTVSVLDTQQAFNGYSLTDVLSAPGAAGSGDNLHPNSFGYTVQAQWMMSTLVPNS